VSPAFARPLLHTVHLLTFALLLATGLLLFLPGLRAALVGGYSLLLRQAHRWGGVAFVLLPAAIFAQCSPRRIFAAPPPRTARSTWQAAHVAITICFSSVFVASGFVLWEKRLFPDPLVDGSEIAHVWLTYVAMAAVALHLLELGFNALIARFQAAAAAAPRSQR
jgi:cytochrome b subunit of formate dehydrogenase